MTESWQNIARNAEIIRRRKAGEWPRAIARSMGLSANAVIGVCNRAGLSGPDGHALTPRGEECGKAKLTADDVRAIRRDYVLRSRDTGGAALARRYGVDAQTVRRAIKGAWAHVQ